VPAATKLRHLRRRETGAGEQDERIKRRETERTGRDGTGLDWTGRGLFYFYATETGISTVVTVKTTAALRFGAI
jgi:hypothetical protein